MKKWAILISSILVLGLIGAGLWLYYKFNTESTLIEHIPVDSEIVVYFNFKRIFMEKAIEKDSTRLTFLKEKIKELSPELSRLGDAGIDPFGDAAFFVHQKDIVFCSMLKDKDQLESVLFGPGGNKAKKSELKDWEFQISSDGQILWMWNDKILYISLKRSDESVKYLQSLSQNFVPFSKAPHYLHCKNDQAPVWFYSQIHPLKNTEPIKGVIHLKNGIQIEAGSLETNLALPIEEFHTLDNFKTVIYADSGHSKFNMILESGYLIFNDIDNGFQTPNFELVDKLVIYEGEKTIQRDFVNYEYDDNFEKVAVKSFKTDTVKSSSLVFRNSNGQIQSKCNYSTCDTNLFKSLPSKLTHFAQFDDTFISKIYTTPIGFLFRLEGYSEGKGSRYIVNIKFKKPN